MSIDSNKLSITSRSSEYKARSIKKQRTQTSLEVWVLS